MPQVSDLVARHGPRFRFACVYIEEAHASDEWPIKEAPIDIRQHATLDDRQAAARTLLDHFGGVLPFEIYLDGMSDPFNAAYPSWPFRFWVLSEEKVMFKAMPRDSCYHLGDLDKFLASLSESD